MEIGPQTLYVICLYKSPWENDVDQSRTRLSNFRRCSTLEYLG